MRKASYHLFASYDSTVVELMTHHPKLEGLDLVIGTERTWQKLITKPLVFRGKASKGFLLENKLYELKLN
jgi:hypothetical protein